MKRRSFMASLLAAAGLSASASGGLASGGASGLQAAWVRWKAAFLAPDGRVVDHRQQEASHSEGQGYGLVLSVFFGDQAAFDLIRSWTAQNLTQRPDPLLNWRLIGGQAAEPMNATDGDLFFAWGLALGADRFDLPEARAWALELATAVAERCLVADPRDPARVLVLPAAEGFLRDARVIVNPSYIMPRALFDLAALTRDERLAAAALDGLAFLSELAASGLAPDWAEVDATGLRASSEHAARFGYDAMRVPLYLIWSGYPAHPAVAQARRMYLAHAAQGVPVVTDLTGSRATETSTFDGFAALRALVTGEHGSASEITAHPLDTDQGYYPATLDLMSRLVAAETSAALFAG